jgi:RNA polymerase sigma factor (sigma-70 family)
MKPLLAHARRGERAFERLYRRHAADVYRYAFVLLRDPHDAERVTQTTFLNAYRAFGRGERPRNSRAWLLALAHGLCRQQARTAHDPEPELEEDLPDEATPAWSEIRRALARLPFTQRSALVMRELESRSYAEIAEVLMLSPAEVETLLFEARRAFRRRLEGALSCHQAERAISRQVDGRLARSERRPLRAHLSECAECAGFARSQRAQRSAWKALARVPLPASLESFAGPGGGTGTGFRRAGAIAAAAARMLAVAAVGAGAVGLAYESVGHDAPSAGPPTVMEHAAPSTRPVRPSKRPTAAPVRATRRIEPKAIQTTDAAATVDVDRATSKARTVAPPPAPTAAAPSQALAVRARAKPRPVGRSQTAAGPPPKPASEQAAPAPSVGAAPAPQPPGQPQFPTAPPLPLPLPLPEPPKLLP